MPMTVHYVDHTNTAQQEVIDDRTYDEGPSDFTMWDYAFKTDAEKAQEWKDWLGLQGNTYSAVRTARELARQNAASAGRQLRSNAYGNADVRVITLDAPPNPGGGVQLRETRRVPHVHWDRGPVNDYGSPKDFNFSRLSDADKESRWKQHFAAGGTVDPNPSAINYGRVGVVQLNAAERIRAGIDPAPARCIDALKFKTWNKTKWTAILGAVIGVVGFVGWFETAGGQASEVKDIVKWAGAGMSTVTITWKALCPTAPSRYIVTLAANDPTGLRLDPVIVTVDDDQPAAAVFVNVPDGKYTATVTVHDSRVAGPSKSIDVVVARPTTTGSAPGAPTGVTVTALPMTVDHLAGVTVSWTAPSGDVTGYTVMLTGTAPAVDPITVEAGAVLSIDVPGVASATYVASVTATNSAGTGPAGTSSAYVLTLPATIPVPDVPRNVRISAYTAEATGKPGLLVLWDPPTTGSKVTGYRVVQGAALATETPYTWATFPGLADGSYSFAVQSKGPGGNSTAVTVTTTLTAANIPADSVDWEKFFSPDQIAAWKAANDVLPTTTEADFWKGAIAAVADTGNQHGGVASFAEQLLLARVLTGWITLPAGTLSMSELDALADRLAAATKPPFPTTAPGTSAPYADHVALWTAASTLLAANGRTGEVLRHKLFAITRCLERYLAPVATHERLYASSTVVSSQRKTTGLAVMTGQRCTFAAKGVVNGVWWYRMPEDTGQNTVLACTDTKELARATGDPGTSGWVYLGFATPVAVTKGDSLILAVHHPNAVTAVLDNGLAAADLVVGNLTSPKDASSSGGPGNGLYDYSATPVIPTKPYLSTEYFISPDFTAS